MGKVKSSLRADPACQRNETENLWDTLIQGMDIDTTILM